jgi:chemotaxis methyl-accepting protein methylase
VWPSTGEDERTLDELARRLGAVAGLELNGSQRLRLTLAARERARESGLGTVAAYAARVGGDDAELHQLLDRVVTGETYFFRNPAHFELLRRRVVPEALRTTPCVRILSAACASGEEPYSIAMALYDWVCQGRVEIAAGDVSDAALRQARAASYERFSFRPSGVDPFAPEVARWFTAAGERRRLDEAVRRAVRFAPLNLLTIGEGDTFPGPYHVVFCRNVFIYFDLATVRRVVARLARLMADGGVLFLGDAESLLGVTPAFQAEPIDGAIVYRKGRPAASSSLPSEARRPSMAPAPPPASRAPSRPEPAVGAGPLARARQAEARHDRALAESEYREAIRAGDQVVEARLALARIYADEGRGDEAIVQAEAALRLDALRAEAHLWIGLVHQSRDAHPLAALAYRRALYCDPDNCVAHFFLSLSLSELGDAPGARAARRQALRLAEAPAAARHAFPGYSPEFVREHCRLLGEG